MFKKVVLILVVLAALLATASPAMALHYSAVLYVDTAYAGTETGTMAQPYSTIDKAVAAAQAMPYGASIYTKNAAGGWTYYGYIAPVNPPYTGTPLSTSALFALLAAGSLVLVLGGWFLLRRSRSPLRQV